MTIAGSEMLTYHGRLMEAEPVGQRSLAQVARSLRHGHATAVHLEPGDGTAYRLLIAPGWDRHYFDGSAGIGPTGAGYLIVSYHSGMGAFMRGVVPGYLMEHMNISNPWTAQLLAWWLDRLWEEIDRQGGVK